MKFYIPILLFFYFFASNNKNIQAAHAVGMDISYDCVGLNQYEVSLQFYYDCSDDENPPNNPLLSIKSDVCGIILPDQFLFQTGPSESNIEVSPLCAAELTNTTCSGGSMMGIKKYTYRNIITLPEACPDWQISFSECCRNISSTNVISNDACELYITAHINNTNGLCNSSPSFANQPVPYFCNTSAVFNQGTIEPDGDELVFTPIAPYCSEGITATYATGYSAAAPLLASTYSFDTNSGQINFTADGQQLSLLTVLVEEYRDGLLIGSVMRDMQFVVLDCTNNQTAIGFPSNPTAYLETCPENTLTFDFEINDPDAGAIVTLNSNVFTTFPGAMITVDLSTSNPLMANFSWTPTASDAGLHNLVLNATDEACPVPATYTEIFTIRVFEAVPDANNDLVYCPEGEAAILQASGGDFFTWEPNADVTALTANGSQVSVTPSITTIYTVTNNCGGTDNVEVSVATGFTATLPESQSICLGDSVAFQPIISIAGDYSFLWEPATGLSNETIENPIASPTETTIYSLTLTDNITGCVFTTATTVIMASTIADLQLTATQDTICSHESSSLLAQLSQLQLCGLNTSGCLGDSELYTLAYENDSLAINAPTPYNGSWEDARLQIVYTADELLALGLTTGTITSLGFEVLNKLSDLSYNNFSIKMGCANEITLANFVPDLAQVFTASGLSTVTGWNTHILDTPYNWDGESGLIIEVCFDNDAWLFKDAVSVHSTLGNTVVYQQADDATGCTLVNPSSTNNRPNIQIGRCTSAPSTPLSIVWQPTTGLSDSTLLNPIANPDTTTTYHISVVENGCTLTDSITIFVKSSPVFSIDSLLEACSGTNTTLSITGSDSIMGLTYQWQSVNNDLSCSDCPNPVVNPIEASTYAVTVTAANGCETALNTQVVPLELPSIDLGDDMVVLLGQTINLNAVGSFDSITWQPSTGLSDASIANPSTTPNETSTYLATAMLLNGCANTDTLTITVRPFTELLMPNAFSPNNDGVNDAFGIPTQGIEAITNFSIYNRWGGLVFSTDDINYPWDGKVAGDAASIGVYAYVITFVYEEKVQQFKGNVTLLR